MEQHINKSDVKSMQKTKKTGHNKPVHVHINI